MRIVLFYSGVESFNYFTDQMNHELQQRNCETFILDLNNPPASDPHSYAFFETFIQKKVDAAICFDGFGLKDSLFIDLWNELHTVTVNILMDHPLRFHTTMEQHPKQYIQFCCDKNHVDYVNTYFSNEVENVAFMPHAGTVQNEAQVIPFAKRKYDILFTGTYYRPKEQWKKINQWFPEGEFMNQFYHVMAEHLYKNHTLTAEQAALDTIQQFGMQASMQQKKTIFRCSEPLDWMIRLHHRERVVQVLAEAGFELWLLGRGWENHPSAGFKNVHRIDDRIPFAQTLPHMANAKICLNVMPWFKAGTHDRIFNTFLQHSLPLTDPSKWLEENYIQGDEIAFYDLGHLEKLPAIAEKLLNAQDISEAMIEKGYEKTKKQFTWKNCVDQMLAAVAAV